MTNTEQVTNFPVYHYEPVPDKPGYQRLVGTAKVTDMISALNAHLKAKGLEPEEYEFHAAPGVRYNDPDVVMPKPNDTRYLIAFAGEGGSEGYYVHCGAILRNPGQPHCVYQDLGFCKTYSPANAYAIATEAQRFLTATVWN